MTGIYKLTGTVQNYAWGGTDYLAKLIHFAQEKDKQYAEWWLGAHISSPSQIEVSGKKQSLIEFLQQNPTALGEKSRAEFGDELPYLLKILDVRLPLSIQLHPTKAQAESGFAEENARAVALTAPTRTYKDNNHKPEMMIALSDFWLLHGFKPKAKILETLRGYPHFHDLAEQLEYQDLHTFYAHIMQANQAQLEQWLNPIFANSNLADLIPENPDYWVLYCREAMEIPADKLDAGLMCFYLFNIVQVPKGQGIYQDAGIPHAYLRGQNIELMACSDNVIRGGLTPKHIDIPELLKVIDCREVIPELIPAADLKAVHEYQTPAKDFALTQFNYNSNESIQSAAKNASILFVMKGELKIQENSTALSPVITLTQGQSVFICAETNYQIQGVEQGYAVLASLP